LKERWHLESLKEGWCGNGEERVLQQRDEQVSKGKKQGWTMCLKRGKDANE
jgi:hypothetical protein